MIEALKPQIFYCLALYRKCLQMLAIDSNHCPLNVLHVYFSQLFLKIKGIFILFSSRFIEI